MNSKDKRLKVSHKALNMLKEKVRRISIRTRGRTILTTIAELNKYMIGWKAYFQIAEIVFPLRDIDKWIRRRLHCYLWKQWSWHDHRELHKRGAERQLAWNKGKSAHNPWCLNKSPALYYALPSKDFAELGLPSMYQ